MMVKKTNISKLSIVEIAWFLYFLMSYTLGNIIRYTHYITTAMLLLAIACTNKGKLSVRKPFKPIIAFYVAFLAWMLLSKLWASESSETQKTIIISMVEIVIMLLCLIDYISSKDVLLSLIKIFVMATAVFACIYYMSSPIKTWGTVGMGGFTPIWRNAAGYYFAYAALFSIYLYGYLKSTYGENNKQLMYIGAFLVVAAVGTGSRKVFVQLGLFVILYVLLHRGLGRKIKLLLGAIIAVVVVITVGMQIPAFQNIYAGRLLSIFEGAASTDSSTITRAYMREYAFELFLKHPVIGSGLNGYTSWLAHNTNFLSRWNITATYSHCNYTELLANSGVIGFGLYYVFMAVVVIKSLKKYDLPFARLGIITVVSFIILDYGTISYYMRFYLFILFVGFICLKLERGNYDTEQYTV